MCLPELKTCMVVEPDFVDFPEVASPKETAYMIAGGRAFFVHDAMRGLGTLTMRVYSGSYVKLRNIRAVPAMPNGEDGRAWLPVGSPAVFFLRRQDIALEENRRYDGDRFPGMAMQLAVCDLWTNCFREVRGVVALEKTAPYKLTTEMSWDGKLRIVMKRFVGEGGITLVFEDRVVFQEDSPSMAWQTIARGKIRKCAFSEKSTLDGLVQDDRESAELRELLYKEVELFEVFRRRGAKYIPTMHIAPSQNRKKVRLDMDFIDGGNLFEILTKGCSWTKGERLEYLRQIAETVQVIHDNGYTYNDLKLEHCLYDRATKEARLGDLDFVGPLGAKKVFGGTYPAPEVCLRQKEAVSTEETKKNDSWALGLVLYALLHDVQTLTNFCWKNSLTKIQEAQRALVGGLNARDPADKLIVDLLAMDPGHRPSMKEVVCRLTHMLSELPDSNR